MDLTATIIQVFGILLVAAGAYIAAPALGVFTLGVGVLAFGLAMERSR